MDAEPLPTAPLSDADVATAIRLLTTPCPTCDAGDGEPCTGDAATVEAMPVPIHHARQDAALRLAPFTAARRRLGLAPLAQPVTHDPVSAAVIAAAAQCHPCFAAAWPGVSAEEDAAFRAWMRRAALDKAWNEDVTNLTDDETAWHDAHHDPGSPVRSITRLRPRICCDFAGVQRRLQFTVWQVQAAYALGALPPWIFTEGKRMWTVALVEAVDRDAVLEQISDQRPLSPEQTRSRLRARIGADFPVHLDLLIKRGHLQPVGTRYGAPVFLPQHVDAVPAAFVEQAVMAPSPPVPAQYEPVPDERESDPFPPGYYEERYAASYPTRKS